jgi:gluconolactonase
VTSADEGRVYQLVAGAPARLIADVGGGANGATVDAAGTLYVAQNGRRFPSDGPAWPASSVGGVQTVSPDGSVTWLTRDPIAPNDLCFGPDGLLYVTDPTRDPRGDDGRLWRVDPVSGEAELLLSVPWFPNGIGFDADDALWVASSFEHRIVRFELRDGRPVDPVSLVDLDDRMPDGFAFDVEGNLLVGALPTRAEQGGEIQVWGADGKLRDVIPSDVGRKLTNVALSAGRHLVITASDAGCVLAIPQWQVAGLPLHPFR